MPFATHELYWATCALLLQSAATSLADSSGLVQFTRNDVPLTAPTAWNRPRGAICETVSSSVNMKDV